MAEKLRAIALNCTLKAEGENSSTDRMIGPIAGHLAEHEVTLSETIRLAAHPVRWGVKSDEGEGDAWPGIRARILAHDILIFGTPIWLGQASSVAKLALERMDAFLGETDEAGRTPAYGKVAVIAVVGNEDGAHHVTAQVAQALNDVGWTIPAAATCYWVGEAMGSTDFKDLPKPPDKVVQTAAAVAANASHLATLLRAEPFPGLKNNAG
jgi:multimeric flavodoxin WrbA